MELEDLKMIWEKRLASSSASAVSRQDARLILQGKAYSIMDKVLRSLKWEIAFAFLFALGSFFLIFSAQTLTSIIFLVLICVYSLGFNYYLLLLYARLQRHMNSVKSVKESLTETISILERFTKIYQRLTTGFVPAVFMAAFLAGLADLLINSHGKMSIPYFAILLSLPIIFIWIFLMRKFTRRYLRRLYGNHLVKMKENLRELSESFS